MAHRFWLADAAATEAAGSQLAQAGSGGLTVHLHGELAAGKTTFARGYLRGLGHTGTVKSPTFTLVETYALPARRVHHFDLYRLVDPGELEFIGIDEYVDTQADCLIEWPERGQGVLTPPDLDIWLQVADTGREMIVKGVSEAGCDVVSRFLRSLNS